MPPMALVPGDLLSKGVPLALLQRRIISCSRVSCYSLAALPLGRIWAQSRKHPLPKGLFKQFLDSFSESAWSLQGSRCQLQVFLLLFPFFFFNPGWGPTSGMCGTESHQHSPLFRLSVPKRHLHGCRGQPLCRLAGGDTKISSGDIPSMRCSFSRTTPPSQNLVEPSWNPGGTLVEPLPQGRPGPPRSLSGHGGTWLADGAQNPLIGLPFQTFAGAPTKEADGTCKRTWPALKLLFSFYANSRVDELLN